MGSNLIVVVPFRLNLGIGSNPMQQGAPMSAVNKLSLKTADEIGRVLGRPESVSPVIEKSTFMNSGKVRFFGFVNGTGYNEFDIRDLKTEKGRYFSKSEEDAGRMVIVIGRTVASSMFGDQDPIGRDIVIKGRKFKVVGIQEKKGSTFQFDNDALSYIPITAAINVFGSSQPNMIMIKAASANTVDEDVAVIKKTLGKTLTKDEFSVITQSDILSFAQSITKILTYLLGAIAGISLLVGGIGIMNIMLVSVTERTREIGIRKAVGAKTRDILVQFLVEAITLSVVGGIIGIILAVLGSKLYERLLNMPSQVTFWIIALAFIFSMLVGVFFGVYPARKASRLDPIESLRYE
jgi:putative ABC transport system permease protein